MIERIHGVTGVYSASDVLSGSVNTDIINMENYGTVTFYILKGVGATGVSKVRVRSNSSNSTASATAEAFRYRAVTSSATPDTWSDIAAATASGISLTAGSKQMYAIEINADELTDGNSWVYLSASETTDSPVHGAIFAVLSNPRYASVDTVTAIS